MVTGWRVSAEQQLSDLALQRLQLGKEGVGDVYLSRHNQVLDRMREAAYSIFEQYLSEKVG